MDSTSKAKEIVIIDDDSIVLECLSRRLRGIRCSLTTFTDQHECLTYLAIERPDILFIDMRMPRMNGVEFIERLMSRPEKCSATIFLCSAMMPSAEIRTRINKFGIQLICKDTLMDKSWLQAALNQCQLVA